jgi:hypothetical protein
MLQILLGLTNQLFDVCGPISGWLVNWIATVSSGWGWEAKKSW